MNLQLRLTLWSVCIMAVIVTSITAVDLTEEVNRQFEITLKRSQSTQRLVAGAVKRSQDREGLGDRQLSEQLQELISESAVVQIAVCNGNGRILNDSDYSRMGAPCPHHDDFEHLVRHTIWWTKAQVLVRADRRFQLTSTMPGGLIEVICIDPGWIRMDIMPSLSTHAGISLASIVGAMFAALIFSTIAFRPLGRVGQMLDRISQGTETEQATISPVKADQFGVVASKVSLLGQKLRGAESEISDLKGNFERLLDELEDAVFVFGRDRRLIAAAGFVDKFIVRPRAELIGQTLAEVFPNSSPLGLLLSQAVQGSRGVRNRRVPLAAADANAPMLIALLSVEFLPTGMLIRLRDPEATRQIGRQLQTADRLSAISGLTGGVAHEVKNPLNAILMHVELAKMKLNHGDYDVTEQMDIISTEILRLDRVVKTFLDFTRPVALNLTDVPLETLVSGIVELASLQAEAGGIEVLRTDCEEAVSVTVDLDLIKQALLNIVVNAIEAMPSGGQLRFDSCVRGDCAEIRISDTGPGIPPDVRDRIYNLYFTTKKQGSGIGLAMTFRIIQLHDGTIDFSSETGKGTSFLVKLPVAVLAH